MRIPVCIFAKPPLAGRAKTRLGAAIGAEAAAELAQAMLCDAWNTVFSLAGAVPILAASERGWFPPALAAAEVWLQGDGDLGTRMERILRRGLLQADAAIVLGADSPQLRRTHIEDALRKLQQQDAVIGPAFDGGYYLLGLRRCPAGLLAGLPWSTPQTRRETEERLLANDFSIASLDALPDVDVPEDLATLLNGSGPMTSQWVERYRHTVGSLPVD